MSVCYIKNIEWVNKRVILDTANRFEVSALSRYCSLYLIRCVPSMLIFVFTVYPNRAELYKRSSAAQLISYDSFLCFELSDCPYPHMSFIVVCYSRAHICTINLYLTWYKDLHRFTSSPQSRFHWGSTEMNWFCS